MFIPLTSPCPVYGGGGWQPGAVPGPARGGQGAGGAAHHHVLHPVRPHHPRPHRKAGRRAPLSRLLLLPLLPGRGEGPPLLPAARGRLPQREAYH